jgi:hypothetical protein
MNTCEEAKCKTKKEKEDYKLRLLKDGFTDMTNQLLKGLKILNDVKKQNS